jgi:hypothetical protein
LERDERVAFAYLYGSFSEGGLFRDIDVGLYFSAIPKELVTESGITMSQILTRELEIPVDVRILNFAPVSFLYHVIRGNLIFERDEEARARVVEKTIQKYLDLKPMIREGLKEAFGG